MIIGLFALILIFGIVSAVAFLKGSGVNTEEEGGLKASDFDITESNE